MNSELSWACEARSASCFSASTVGPGMGATTGVREENTFLRDGKKAMAERLVRQDVVDA